MKTKKTNYLIFTIVIILLITILFSIFLIKSNTGNATKIMDSKQSFETTTINNTLSSQKLTEFNIPTKEQLDTTSISQTFKENTEIDLKLDKPITALSVTGNTTLLSEVGLVRIILVDSEKHEYLVYETSSLLAENSKDTKFENVCEETCVINKPITPIAIKIQVEDATLNLSLINTLSEVKPFTEIKDIKSYKQETLKLQNQAKIEKYNSSQKSWTAGETSVSNLSYEEQKKLFTREDGTIPEYLPNLQGFLNYKGGIFTLEYSSENTRNTNNTTTQPPITPPEAEPNYTLPNSFDWRNFNGENWMTPVKNQGGAGTCGYFSSIGTFESRINLYYNQHLNVDLSEQMIIDCPGQPYPDSDYSFNNCNQTLAQNCKIINEGVADESCDVYAERNPDPENCSYNYICGNYNNRTWRNSIINYNNTNYYNYYLNENYIKGNLIKYGPLNSGILSLFHAMTLVGFKGASDWKTIENCSPNGLDSGFCSDSGCISRQCYQGGATLSVCNNFIDYSIEQIDNQLPIGELLNYECLPFGNGYRWTYIDSTTIPDVAQSSCVDGAMQPIPFTPILGQQECGGISWQYKSELKEYTPNNGDFYWIFKNSWGEDWGENGYANIVTSVTNIALINMYSGIVIPPTNASYWPAGFDNTINCEDRDGDHYCNWGISEEKPSTCPSLCNAEKDCDDSNPDLLGFKSKTDLRCRYRYEIQN